MEQKQTHRDESHDAPIRVEDGPGFTHVLLRVRFDRIAGAMIIFYRHAKGVAFPQHGRAVFWFRPVKGKSGKGGQHRQTIIENNNNNNRMLIKPSSLMFD